MAAEGGEQVRLALAHGGWLHGDLERAQQSETPIVLFIHGFGSRRGGDKADALAAACRRRCWSFAAFDFRGHGESSGTLLELRGSGLLADLEAIRDYLGERGGRELCLVGSSMGGWAATWFALAHPESVAACVLLAPAFGFVSSRWAKLTEEERRAWKETGRLRVTNDWVDAEIGYGLVEEMERFPQERLAAQWVKPLLIYHGLRDDVVPYTHSLNFVEKTAGMNVELRLLKEGDHRLTAFKDEIAEAACGFFAKHVG